MAVAQKLRKGLLVLHIAVSVGWIGAALTFLAVAVGTRQASAPEMTQSGMAIMEAIGWTVLVPLSVASLVTGIVQSLVTPWGLVRHYWVLAKLLITVVATAVLLVFMEGFGHGGADAGGLHGNTPGSSSILHATGGLVLLVLALLLSVYKPRGLTGWGMRKVQP